MAHRGRADLVQGGDCDALFSYVSHVDDHDHLC